MQLPAPQGAMQPASSQHTEPPSGGNAPVLNPLFNAVSFIPAPTRILQCPTQPNPADAILMAAHCQAVQTFHAQALGHARALPRPSTPRVWALVVPQSGVEGSDLRHPPSTPGSVISQAEGHDAPEGGQVGGVRSPSVRVPMGNQKATTDEDDSRAAAMIIKRMRASAGSAIMPELVRTGSVVDAPPSPALTRDSEGRGALDYTQALAEVTAINRKAIITAVLHPEFDSSGSAPTLGRCRVRVRSFSPAPFAALVRASARQYGHSRTVAPLLQNAAALGADDPSVMTPPGLELVAYGADPYAPGSRPRCQLCKEKIDTFCLELSIDTTGFEARPFHRYHVACAAFLLWCGQRDCFCRTTGNTGDRHRCNRPVIVPALISVAERTPVRQMPSHRSGFRGDGSSCADGQGPD